MSAIETTASPAQTITIHYTVNDIPQQTQEPFLRATAILSEAGFDPSQHYLVELQGHKQKSYKDRPNEMIKMHSGQVFLAISTGCTPVS